VEEEGWEGKGKGGLREGEERGESMEPTSKEEDKERGRGGGGGGRAEESRGGRGWEGGFVQL